MSLSDKEIQEGIAELEQANAADEEEQQPDGPTQEEVLEQMDAEGVGTGETEEETPEETPAEPDPWASVREKYTPEQIAELEQTLHQRQQSLDVINNMITTQGPEEAAKHLAAFSGYQKPEEPAQPAFNFEPPPEPEDPENEDPQMAWMRKMVSGIAQTQQDTQRQLAAQAQADAVSRVDSAVERAMNSDSLKPVLTDPNLRSVIQQQARQWAFDGSNGVNHQNLQDKLTEYVGGLGQAVMGVASSLAEQKEQERLSQLNTKKTATSKGIAPGGGPRRAPRAKPPARGKPNTASRSGREEAIAQGTEFLTRALRG